MDDSGMLMNIFLIFHNIHEASYHPQGWPNKHSRCLQSPSQSCGWRTDLAQLSYHVTVAPSFYLGEGKGMYVAFSDSNVTCHLVGKAGSIERTPRTVSEDCVTLLLPHRRHTVLTNSSRSDRNCSAIILSFGNDLIPT